MQGRWKMPQPEQGDIVLWYMNADASVVPRPAIVVESDSRGLALFILIKGQREGDGRMGVRHMRDPDLSPSVPQREHLVSKGCWDFRLSDPRRNIEDQFVAPTKPVAAGPIVPDRDEILQVLDLKYVKKLARPDYIAKKVCGGWDADVVKKILAQYTKEQALQMLGVTDSAQESAELVAAGADE